MRILLYMIGQWSGLLISHMDVCLQLCNIPHAEHNAVVQLMTTDFTRLRNDLPAKKFGAEEIRISLRGGKKLFLL